MPNEYEQIISSAMLNQMLRSRQEVLPSIRYAYNPATDSMSQFQIAKPTKRAVAVAAPDSVVAGLAERARDVLGYSVLHNEVTKPLARALSELEIEILDEPQVKQYQENMVRDASIRGTVVGKEAAWEAIAISRYNRPIPEFVLNKAVQIKERLPEAEFFVEELNVKRIPDPFLVVQFGLERYYVEVWDEAKFEGRLEGGKK